MTKISNGIGYAKIDSIALVIPETAVLRNGSAIGKTTWEIDADSVLIQERQNKSSQQFERDGIKFTVQLQRRPPLETESIKDVIPEIVIPMPSKILGIEHYDQGFTLDNYELGTRWIEKATGIRFQPHAWENASFRDMDNAIDTIANPKQWSQSLQELWERIEPETRSKYGRLFKTKAGLVHGLQMNTRQREANRTVTARYPFLKLYDKALEIQESRKTGSTWGMEYQPGERKRFESQIRNNYWKDDPLLSTVKKPRTWAELLTVYQEENELMTQYANEVIYRGYVTREARPKTKRDMRKETPMLFLTREMMELIRENHERPLADKWTPVEIKNLVKLRYRAAFGDTKGQATRFDKMVEENWAIIQPTDPDQLEM